MLTEIQCSKFLEKGKPRPTIVFTAGLNTVLGDQVGSNSIGKSTFLMIVDFAFGGSDYIDKSQDVQRQVGHHTIQFSFTFNGKAYYFSRNTITPNRVNKCDSIYRINSDISIDDFRKFLLNGYGISLPSISFRDIITRYFRIYRRENLNENHPLRSFPQERMEDSITSLLRLFNKYSDIEELKNTLKTAKERNNIFKKSIQYDYVHAVTTKKQLKENEGEICVLTQQLDRIAGSKDGEEQFLEGLASEDAKRVSTVKRELTSLRRQKSRLETKLASIQNNLGNTQSSLQDDFSVLLDFFPLLNIRRIQEIEKFHEQLRGILATEFRGEQTKTEAILSQIEQSIDEHQAIIEDEGVPDGISKKTLDFYHTIKSKIEQLQQQNDAYTKQQELKNEVSTIESRLRDRETGHLDELQSLVTRKMTELNNFIYNEKKKAPILTLKNGRQYVFETPDDTGTGTSYKGLAVFDLSVLELTPLPALVHDSVVLKQIADAPLEKILELYQQSGKQVFIAIDKVSSYTEHAQEILEQSSILHLSDKGSELFGRSWNQKHDHTTI
jgi:hypothetical protein